MHVCVTVESYWPTVEVLNFIAVICLESTPNSRAGITFSKNFFSKVGRFYRSLQKLHSTTILQVQLVHMQGSKIGNYVFVWLQSNALKAKINSV